MHYSISPNLGKRKPTIRPASGIPYARMGKGDTRRRKTPSLLRGVIAKNVSHRARVMFPLSKNLVADIRAASGTTDSERMARSHIQRIMKAETSASLEQLEGLARALDLSAYQLLIHDLDPRNPQVVRGAAPGEEAAYRKIAREEVEAILSRSTVSLPNRPKK